MRYKKRNFRSVVINLRAVKNIIFGIILAVIYFFFVMSIDIGTVSTEFLKMCLADTVKNIPDQKFFSFEVKNFFDNKNLICKALPYINVKESKVSEKSICVPEEKAKNKQEKTEKTQILSTGLSIKNETNYTVDVESILYEKPCFKLEKNKPLVLIVHTHASESFTSNGEFETTDTDRTLDTRYNMIAIGEEFAKVLSENGINVIHDKTIHDYPSYTSSYKRTLATIEMYLEKYPSIQMVFDIHRDGLTKADGTKIKLSSNIEGVETAQVMVLCGTDENGLEFDGWEDNLRLAMQIQKTMETDYPTLARPLNLSKNRYNMHKTRGSLIFEIGTNGNTLDEALNGAKLMAECTAKTIVSLSE